MISNLRHERGLYIAINSKSVNQKAEVYKKAQKWILRFGFNSTGSLRNSKQKAVKKEKVKRLNIQRS